MSEITLTSAVRSNLLSLQNTADLLGRTQERLSTGKKVNTALDNPSNFFTAQGLDSRASDLSKLLDSVSNSVQVLKAADAGITGLQKLIDSAKSTARSALQSTNAYTTKASVTSGALAAAATEDDVRGGATLDTKVLTVTNSSGKAATVTFGTGAGEVKTLADLNAALAAADVQASVTSDGKLSITTTNASGADTFVLTGTAATPGFGAASVNSSAVTFDANAQTTRANLRKDYNELLNQITKLAQDSSFNGVNLLNGDDLSVIFNEKGNSKLDIKGVTFDATSLGLNQITDTDFLDGSSINAVLDKLTTATNTLRAQGSKFGSNLSIVQTRQEFSKNLINVLSTGSANLTLADINEEGANYSALNTRQQLSTTALALSAQSQQQVLQLLR